jgi:hypothetical protein
MLSADVSSPENILAWQPIASEFIVSRSAFSPLAVVDRTARFQRDYNGKQPGDPAKAAAAVLHVASLNDPLLGSDAVRSVEQNHLAKMESDRKWRELSISLTSRSFSDSLKIGMRTIRI